MQKRAVSIRCSAATSMNAIAPMVTCPSHRFSNGALRLSHAVRLSRRGDAERGTRCARKDCFGLLDFCLNPGFTWLCVIDY